MNFMPFAITKLVWIIWTEGGYDRTTTIVYFKDDGSIFHVKKEIVSSSFDCCQNSSQVPGLDHHGDVKVKTDHESPLCSHSSASGTKEKSRLNLF